MSTDPQIELRDRIAEALRGVLPASSFQDVIADDAADAVLAVLPPPADQAAVCICGHTEQQHFEDVCITEVTGCDCGDYLPPDAAREVIARWRQAAIDARADRGTVLREAADRYEGILAKANPEQDPRYWTAVRDITLGLRHMAGEAQQQPDTETHDRLARIREWVTSDVVTATNEFGNGYREAQRDIRDLLGPGRVADEGQPETPFTPPAHYRRDDGVECCVHTVPVGPDSCRECRDLDQPAVPARTAASDVLAKAVAALQAKAAELSTEAEEEMRRDLEEQAQVWHEAADMVRRVGRKAADRG